MSSSRDWARIKESEETDEGICNVFGRSSESDVVASLLGLLLVVRGHNDLSSELPWAVRRF